MIKSFLKYLRNIVTSFLRLFKFNSNDLNQNGNELKSASIKDIQVLHQSCNYLVVNKRYDVLINSNKSDDTVTVQTQLRNLFPELVNPQLGHEFNFIHRLDYATSGVLCLPVHKNACKHASHAFENHAVEKYYLAIVRGHISQETLQIEIGVGKDSRPEFKGIRMAVEGSPFVSKPRPAFTRILVLERGISHDFPATKVLLKPVTGRRHQLRLHLSVLGHTIVGDFTYSNRRDVLPFRMFLHAFRMVLPSPLENIDIQTADPFCESDPRNRWHCVEVVNTLDTCSMQLLKEDQHHFLKTVN